MGSVQLSQVVGQDALERFCRLALALFAEAFHRKIGPSAGFRGRGVKALPKDRLRRAATEYLVACGLLRHRSANVFVITESGEHAGWRVFGIHERPNSRVLGTVERRLWRSH